MGMGRSFSILPGFAYGVWSQLAKNISSLWLIKAHQE